MISDLLRVTGGAGQQVPARTQLLRHLDAVAFSVAEEEMAFHGRGARGNRQGPPMKMQRARKLKASSFHYRGSVSAGWVLAHFNWHHQQSGCIRHSAL